MEFHFYADLHVHGSAILKSRVELPVSDRVNRFLVEAEPESTHHTNVTGMTGRIDDQPQCAGSLLLGAARFLGVLRIRSGSRRGSRNSAAHLVNSAADATTAARSNSRSM